MWCVAPLEMNEGNSLGTRVQSAYRLQCRKDPTRDLKKNHFLGSDLPASFYWVPGSIAGRLIWNSWWERCSRTVFFSEYFRFPLSVLFHRLFIFIFQSSTPDAIRQLSSLNKSGVSQTLGYDVRKNVALLTKTLCVFLFAPCISDKHFIIQLMHNIQWYLTNFSANEDFFRCFLDSANEFLVDARANIKQQTWTVCPFHERSSINFGQIFDFSFSKETEASYWRRGDLPWINFENLEEE